MPEQLLLLTLVVGAAAALNPSILGVFILFMATILGKGRSPGRMLWLGLSYSTMFLGVSLAVGGGLLYLLNLLPPPLASYTLLVIWLLVVCVGLLEIKDYFWHGQGPSLRISEYFAAIIKTITKRSMTWADTVLLGLLVGTIALPCTIAPYVAIIALALHSAASSPYVYVLAYNAATALSILFLLVLVATGTKVSLIQRWRQDNKGRLHLTMGLLLLILGCLVVLNASLPPWSKP